MRFENGLAMEYLRPLLLLALVVSIAVLSTTSVVAKCDSNAKFYIYGLRTCPHCRALHQLLVEHFGFRNVYICYIKESKMCYERLWKMYKVIEFEPVVPLTIVIRDGLARCIVIGEVDDVEFWKRLAGLGINCSEGSCRIPIYVGEKVYGYLVFSNRSELIEFTKFAAPEFFNASLSQTTLTGRFVKVGSVGKASATYLISWITLLPETVALALSDSINPCALYIYVVLLIAAALSAHESSYSVRKHVASIGLAFVSAVYVGYMLLGLGLMKAVSMLPIYAPLASAIAIGFGGWTIATGVLKKSRVAAKGFVLERIPGASVSIPLSFALGLLVTFTLLPCSAGPYLLFVTMVKGMRLGTLDFLSLLIIYNAVFVSPMIAVLLFISSISKLERVQKFIVSKGGTLSVVSGAVLVVLGIYVLFAYG